MSERNQTQCNTTKSTVSSFCLHQSWWLIGSDYCTIRSLHLFSVRSSLLLTTKLGCLPERFKLAFYKDSFCRCTKHLSCICQLSKRRTRLFIVVQVRCRRFCIFSLGFHLSRTGFLSTGNVFKLAQDIPHPILTLMYKGTCQTSWSPWLHLLHRKRTKLLKHGLGSGF